jgi:serine/threonine-protein kinase
MAQDGGTSARLRNGGPDLSYLERLLGDVLVEGEMARTPRAAIYRIRVGSQAHRATALKVALHQGSAEDLAQLRHEVRLLSEVRHPNVVEVYDFGVLPGDFPFLTMELVEGGDLRQTLERGGWPVFWDVAIQAASGLAHIHRHGVLHLDIKPENLGLVETPSGPQIKILDFGLSQCTRGPARPAAFAARSPMRRRRSCSRTSTINAPISIRSA